MTTSDGAPRTFTIGEVSSLTGLTTHTLRFYEQEGLFFAPVRRNSAGRRVFTGEEVEWLKVCTKLRSSGMPLPDIRRYAQLVLAGPGNEDERLKILRNHEASVQQQVADLQEALAVIHHKVEIYLDHLAAGTADRLWTNGPECEPVHARPRTSPARSSSGSSAAGTPPNSTGAPSSTTSSE